MDDRLQRLKKAASMGDPDAIAELSVELRRTGIAPAIRPMLSTEDAEKLPYRTLRAGGQVSRKRSRAAQRLHAHNKGTCGKKCRFCRRYGSNKIS